MQVILHAYTINTLTQLVIYWFLPVDAVGSSALNCQERWVIYNVDSEGRDIAVATFQRNKVLGSQSHS